MAVIYRGKNKGFAVFETTTFKLVYHQESEFQIEHISLFYHTLKFAVVFSHKITQYDYDVS